MSAEVDTGDVKVPDVEVTRPEREVTLPEGADGMAVPECDPLTAPLPLGRDEAAVELVRRYACAHLDKTDGPADFDVYVVWKCFILGSCKWLVSTTLRDGMYYEVTYNAERMEYYLDAYKKFDNACITAERRYA